MARYGWAPYVSAAQRRAQALLEMDKLRKEGKTIRPVEPFKRRKIARTFWGQGWCEHLETFSDYENRLPRGRTYVRNGSVCHLDIGRGRVDAIVSGSDLYEVTISIKTIPKGKWDYIRTSCTGRIGSLLELLQGRFSDEAMKVVTDRHDGLFPLPGEMTFDCTCPDWAVMCKHVAAVLYGVGARLDDSPELIFELRGVDHEELIGGEAIAAATAAGRRGGGRRKLKGDVASVFGVEVDESDFDKPAAKQDKRTGRRSRTGSKTPRKTKAKAKKKASRAKAASPAGSSANKPLTGKGVAALRRRMGLSAAAFAERVGVTAQTVYNWEKTKGRLRLRRTSKEALDDLL
jgi:uncharacterized Zn finger protein